MQLVSHRRTLCPKIKICCNYIIYRSSVIGLDCLTFFLKIVEQRTKNAVTPIMIVSCVSQARFGTAWDTSNERAGTLGHGIKFKIRTEN